MAKNPSANESQPVDLTDQASNSTLALNPLVNIRGEDLADSARILFQAMLKEPASAANHWFSFLSELGNIATGQSERKPLASDKRFADAAWQNSKLHHGLLQAYLAWSDQLQKFIDQSTLEGQEKARAQLFASILVDSMAPTNNFSTNPAAVRTFVDTGGESLMRGFKNFIEDWQKNGGMPSQVDKTPFKVGENLAATPGAVVFRNDLIELIQYAPMTTTVFKRPLVVTPPQINKFYSMDLTPDKSLIQFLLQNGIQSFIISWRNPTPENRDWGLDTYVAAVDEAVDAVREITGSKDVSMFGACSGGITLSAYLAMLAGRDEKKVKNATIAVCVLDVESAENQLSCLITPETMEAAKAVSRLRGVLDGEDLAKMFAWMRPNDLIWNYWVNNYLLGKTPPAFDILFWNADTTRLPARLHHDYIDLGMTNPFVHANRLTLNGTPIDLSKVDVDAYVVAGVMDHITPWNAVYRTARLYGDDVTFILSNAGHLQAMINPPTNPKASYSEGKTTAATPEEFVATTTKQNGSWWLNWGDWLGERSGSKVKAPAKLGSTAHPPLAESPGTYVFE